MFTLDFTMPLAVIDLPEALPMTLDMMYSNGLVPFTIIKNPKNPLFISSAKQIKKQGIEERLTMVIIPIKLHNTILA